MSGSVFSLASELKDCRALPGGLIQSSVLSVSAMVASARFGMIVSTRTAELFYLRWTFNHRTSVMGRTTSFSAII